MTSTIGSERRPPIGALTGLRFLAASHVVFLHYFVPLVRSGPEWAFNMAASGQAAVSLFYILSGFVLSYSTTGNGGALRTSRRGFWVARFARIYPVYALALILYAPHAVGFMLRFPGGVLNSGIEAFLNFTLLQAWFPNRPLLWNPPGWSLSVEAFFYLMFPFICIPLLTLTRRASWVLIVTMTLVAFVPRLLFTLTYEGGQMPADNFSQPWVLFWTIVPVLRLPEFIIGICVARLVLDRRPGTYGGAPPAFYTVIVLVALVVLFALMGTPTLQFLVVWLALPLFAALIWLLSSSHNVITRLFSTPALILLGEVSYATYILQEPVHIWMRTFGKRITGLTEEVLIASPVFFLLFYGILLFLSVVSFKWLEGPARKWITRRFGEKRTDNLPVPLRVQVDTTN